jgi:hypothetical protein
MHGQAMLVLFTVDVQFHEVPRKTLTGALRLGTVRKGAVYAQRAIDG